MENTQDPGEKFKVLQMKKKKIGSKKHVIICHRARSTTVITPSKKAKGNFYFVTLLYSEFYKYSDCVWFSSQGKCYMLGEGMCQF